MKRVGNLIEKIADTDNLLFAYYKAAQGKWFKQETRDFALSLQRNIAKLRDEILSSSPEVGHYQYFNIEDPKPRLICAASFPERVLHHAIMNVCHPYFERQLVETTYATRPQKGVYQALGRTRRAARRYRFVAKCDFRRYFDSINHEILKCKLCRLFKDRALLSIFDSIVNSYCKTENKGIPIGNLTSQYFANYYLSSQDHLCKEQWGVKEYIRYMDDFLLFSNSFQALLEETEAIRKYSADALDLTLKPIVFAETKDGIPFLGYKIFPHKVLLNTRSKRRLKSKIREYDYLLRNEIWSEKTYLEHVTPLLSFARYGYTKELRHGLLNGNRLKAPTACFAAEAGTTTLRTAASRIGTTILPATVTTTTASALSLFPELSIEDGCQ